MNTKIKPLLGAALCLVAIVGSSNTASAEAPVDSRIVLCGPVTDRKTHQITYQILSMLPDGSRPTQLTTTGGTYPAWSPNGKYVAYHRSTTLEKTIYVLEVKTGRRFAVVQSEGGHDWSPDGTGILFTAPSEAGSGLWLVGLNPDTGAVGTPILLKEGGYTFPKFSPDGTKIAFWRNGLVGTLDLTTQAEISFGPGSGGGPSWSPDGTKIAFGGVVCYSSTSTCHSEIVVANADGTGGWTPVTSLYRHSDFPVWSPDGQQLAFRSIVNGSNSIYKTTIGTGAVTLVYAGGQPVVDWAR